jgi:hypothetical protein
MSRFTRILAMAVGSVALFALFAVAGWAITDQFTSEESAPVTIETVALEEYPLIPAEDDIEEQFARIDAQTPVVSEPQSAESTSGESQEETGTTSVSSRRPDSVQTIRVVRRSLVDVVESPDPSEAGGTTPPSDAASSSTSTALDGGDSTVPDSGEADEESMSEVTEDTPFLFGDLGLRDLVVADPLGPIRFDLCAGSAFGSSVPAGCPPGIGGIVTLIDDDVDPTINALVFGPNTAFETCGASDDTTWKLKVTMSTPGTLNLALWEGDRGSSRPPGAFFAAIEAPPAAAAAMTASLDSGATGADSERVFFCIEVPAMAKNTPIIAEEFVVSSYPPHGGARGPLHQYDVSLYEADPRVGLRPPSLISSAPGTDDVVYATIYRRESEQTWVKAVEIQSWVSVQDVCNTDGSAIGPAGPVPSGTSSPSGDTIIVGDYVRTANVGTSGGWPYDPLIDKADGLRVQFAPGNTYAVCTYAVDGGDSLTPRVVHSEATFVATPTTREIDIEISGIQGVTVAPTAERVEFSVRPQIEGCRGGNVEFPGPNSGVFGQDLPICHGTASGVRAAGGFAIKVQSFSRDGDSDWGNTNEAWIPVDPSELTCVWDCRETLERVVRLPAPDEVLNATRRQGVTISLISLTIRFEPPAVTGFPEWTIGPVGTFDNTNPELPAEPVIAWETTFSRRSTDPVTGNFAALLVGVVTADRPVTIDSVYFDHSIPGFDCEVDGFGGEFDEESPEFSTRHQLSFNGLCFGASYRLVMEATDESGSHTIRTSTVTTAAPAIVLHASLELEALSFHYGGREWFQDFGPLEGVGLSPYDTPTAELLGDEEALTGWKRDAEPRRDYRICDGGIPGYRPFPRLWELEIGASSYYNIGTSVTRGSYVRSNEADCEVARGLISGFVVDGEIHIGGELTLNELFDGAEFVDSTTSGERKLTLTAEWAP